MSEKQEIVTIAVDKLIERVGRLAREGYRLVQIGCSRLDQFQIDYSFDRDYAFLNLRVRVPVDGAAIPSISGIYWTAFTYENEIHDLFGIEVTHLNIDYGGNFYRIELKAPFSVTTAAKNESQATIEKRAPTKSQSDLSRSGSSPD